MALCPIFLQQSRMDVRRSIEFYGNKLGFAVEINKAPQFAMIRVGEPTGGTIGLLVHVDSNDPLGLNSDNASSASGYPR